MKKSLKSVHQIANSFYTDCLSQGFHLVPRNQFTFEIDIVGHLSPYSLTLKFHQNTLTSYTTIYTFTGHSVESSLPTLVKLLNKNISQGIYVITSHTLQWKNTYETHITNQLIFEEATVAADHIYASIDLLIQGYPIHTAFQGALYHSITIA